MHSDARGARSNTCKAYSDPTQSVRGTSNDMGTRIGGASVGDTEKAGWKAESLQKT